MTREWPGKHWASVILLVLSLVVSATPAVVGQEPSANPLDILDEVSEENLADTVEALQSFGSRAFVLPSADQAAAYLASEFAAMGLEVQEQEFPVGDRTSRNIIAWKNGTDPERAHVLLGAHYDSENRLATNFALAESLPAPGADDDASGIAVVLEAARLLSTTVTASTVKFVAFGAEEVGYEDSGGIVGSTFFANAEYLAGVEYRATIILDMIGYRTEERNLATVVVNRHDDPVASMIEEAAGMRDVDLEIRTLVKSGLKYSDHASFWARAYPSVLVTEELDPVSSYPLNPYYHTEADTLDKLSLDQVEAVAEAVIGATLLTADMDAERTAGSLPLAIGISVVAGVTVTFIIASRRRNNDGTGS